MSSLHRGWVLPCIILYFGLFLHATTALSKVEVVEFDDAEKQELYQQLINELRCLVCQNQNLAGSNADLATDLRKRTRELVAGGKSYSEIVDYMIARYGDFVMYKPPFNKNTLFLWLSPIALLLTAFLVLLVRRRRAPLPRDPFDAESHSRVRRLLEQDASEPPKTNR